MHLISKPVNTNVVIIFDLLNGLEGADLQICEFADAKGRLRRAEPDRGFVLS